MNRRIEAKERAVEALYALYQQGNGIDDGYDLIYAALKGFAGLIGGKFYLVDDEEIDNIKTEVAAESHNAEQKFWLNKAQRVLSPEDYKKLLDAGLPDDIGDTDIGMVESYQEETLRIAMEREMERGAHAMRGDYEDDCEGDPIYDMIMGEDDDDE